MTYLIDTNVLSALAPAKRGLAGDLGCEQECTGGVQLAGQCEQTAYIAGGEQIDVA